MKRKWVGGIALVAAATVAMAAEMVTVNVAEIKMRAEADRLSPTIGLAAPKGTQLEVKKRQGDYLLVSYQGRDGWIQASKLEPLKIGKSFGSSVADTLDGDNRSGEVQSAGASKGLLEKAEEYARSVGVDPKKVDALRARRDRIIDSGEARKFETAGKLGGR